MSRETWPNALRTAALLGSRTVRENFNTTIAATGRFRRRSL
jgi:hypothetical protein